MLSSNTYKLDDKDTLILKAALGIIEELRDGIDETIDTMKPGEILRAFDAGVAAGTAATAASALRDVLYDVLDEDDYVGTYRVTEDPRVTNDGEHYEGGLVEDAKRLGFVIIEDDDEPVEAA